MWGRRGWRACGTGTCRCDLCGQHNTAVMQPCCSGWAAVWVGCCNIAVRVEVRCARTISYYEFCVEYWVSSKAFLYPRVMLVPYCLLQCHSVPGRPTSSCGRACQRWAWSHLLRSPQTGEHWWHTSCSLDTTQPEEEQQPALQYLTPKHGGQTVTVPGRWGGLCGGKGTPGHSDDGRPT